MNRRIDLHSHCLPNIDDGAKSVEESLSMLRESYRQGVGICAATPHCTVHRQADIDRFLAKRQAGFDKIKNELKEGEHPKVILGAEVYLDNDLNNYEGIEKLCLENTSYIMLEFPIDKANPAWAEWIYALNRKGLKVLVAHVDRYPEWEKMMADFKGLDVKYQVNASRFIEFMGGRLLKALMGYNHGYIISSDMHNTTTRACNIEKAYIKAKKKYPEVVDQIFGLNAEKILGL